MLSTETGAFLVLVSVGISIQCVNLRGAAREEMKGKQLNIGDFRYASSSCLNVQNGVGRIMSPLL